MWWYLGSLLALIALIWVMDLAGAALVSLLPTRQQPVAQIFLGPALGTTLLVFLATVIGWLGHGYRLWFCLPPTLALPAVGLGIARRWPAPRRLLDLAVFTVLASFPILCPLARFDGYNPFNDIFIYISNGQWLQSHGFLEPAQPDRHHPVWTQVAGFQQTGLRMGASFVLGWLQALFGLRWSYQIYPVAVALGLVVGALAVGGIVAAACPGRRLESWLAALAAATTLNGFASGSVYGFFHQTYGLAFLTAILALRGMEMADERADHSIESMPISRRLRRGLPMACAGVAVVLCYVELTPFLAAGLGLSYLSPWPDDSREWRRRWNRLWPVAALGLLFVNLEWVRAWRALRMQVGILVGNPVTWHWWEFPAHALGLKANLYDEAPWPSHFRAWPVIIGWIAAGTLLFGLVAGRYRYGTFWRRAGRIGPRPRALVPAWWLAGLFSVAFVYFRWRVPNPWPDSAATGQSWSQFKLSNWAAPAGIALLAGTVTWLSARWKRAGRAAVILALAIWCCTGLRSHFQKAKQRTSPILLATGTDHDPFACYLNLRQSLAIVPTSSPLRLEAPAGDFYRLKTCQMLTYFLADRELVGNWSDDFGEIVNSMPDTEHDPTAETCEWRLVYQPPVGPPRAFEFRKPFHLERETVP